MKAMRSLLVFSMLGVSPFLAGCGGGATPAGGGATGAGPAATSAATTADGVKRVDAGALPKVGDYLPPLDDGKVEVPTPGGKYITAGKKSTYLCAFLGDKSGGLPRIVVKASPSMVDGFADVTPDNVVAFAEALDGKLDTLEKSPKSIVERVRPLILGDNAWGRYVKEMTSQGSPVEVQVLQTSRGGRMYSIELQVAAGKITSERDIAYAVAANMKFAGTEAPAVEAPMTEEKKEEPKKDDAKPADGDAPNP